MNKNFKWWCEDINYIHKVLNKEIEANNLDVVAVLECPFADIELTIRDYETDGTPIYDYFCCINKTGEKNDWESYDGVDFGEVNPKEFTTEKELIEDMELQLIKFCKENDLKMY